MLGNVCTIELVCTRPILYTWHGLSRVDPIESDRYLVHCCTAYCTALVFCRFLYRNDRHRTPPPPHFFHKLTPISETAPCSAKTHACKMVVYSLRSRSFEVKFADKALLTPSNVPTKLYWNNQNRVWRKVQKFQFHTLKMATISQGQGRLM